MCTPTMRASASSRARAAGGLDPGKATAEVVSAALTATAVPERTAATAILPETRCCDESGRCELGMLVEWLDAGLELPRRVVAADRTAMSEGGIRREMGLCIGCRPLRLASVVSCSRDKGGEVRWRMGRLRKTGAVPRGRCCALRAARSAGSASCSVRPAPSRRPGKPEPWWLGGGRKEKNPPTARNPAARDVAGLSPGTDVGRRSARLPACSAWPTTRGRVVFGFAGVADLRAGLTAAADDPACAGGRLLPDRTCTALSHTARERAAGAASRRSGDSCRPANDLGDDLFDD